MKSYIVFLLVVFILFSGSKSFAQDVVLSEDVKADTVVPKWGPNMKKSLYVYLGYEMIIGESESKGAEILYGRSGNALLGLRYKKKICNFWSTGFDFGMGGWLFHLKQTKDKVLPNNIIHDKERLSFGALSLEWFNRFNFDKRGNYMGKYFDIGVFGCWYSSPNHYTKDKLENVNENNAGLVEVTNKNLAYAEDFGYGVKARIGFNRFMFTGTYRLSDLFKPEFDVYPELPRISVGIQIGLHK